MAPPGILKVIVSSPGFALAHWIARRSECAPLSFVLVTTRSQPATVLLVLDELLLVFGSNVVLPTFAVLLTVDPGRAVTSTWSVIVTDPPELTVPSVQCTLPLLPGDGAVHDP